MDAVDCCCGSSSNAAAEACGCFPDCLFEACLRCCCMSCGECCCDMLSIFSSGVCTPALMIIDYSCSWTRRSVRYGLVAFGILIACTLLIIGSVQLGRQAGVSGVALLVPGVFAFLLSLFLACGLCYASCAQRLDEGPSPATLARLPAALKPQSLRSASSRRWLESLPAGRVELQEVETRITRQGASQRPPIDWRTGASSSTLRLASDGSVFRSASARSATSAYTAYTTYSDMTSMSPSAMPSAPASEPPSAFVSTRSLPTSASAFVSTRTLSMGSVGAGVTGELRGDRTQSLSSIAREGLRDASSSSSSRGIGQGHLQGTGLSVSSARSLRSERARYMMMGRQPGRAGDGTGTGTGAGLSTSASSVGNSMRSVSSVTSAGYGYAAAGDSRSAVASSNDREGEIQAPGQAKQRRHPSQQQHHYAQRAHFAPAPLEAVCEADGDGDGDGDVNAQPLSQSQAQLIARSPASVAAIAVALPVTSRATAISGRGHEDHAFTKIPGGMDWGAATTSRSGSASATVSGSSDSPKLIAPATHGQPAANAHAADDATSRVAFEPSRPLHARIQPPQSASSSVSAAAAATAQSQSALALGAAMATVAAASARLSQQPRADVTRMQRPSDGSGRSMTLQGRADDAWDGDEFAMALAPDSDGMDEDEGEDARARARARGGRGGRERESDRGSGIASSGSSESSSGSGTPSSGDDNHDDDDNERSAQSRASAEGGGADAGVDIGIGIGIGRRRRSRSGASRSWSNIRPAMGDADGDIITGATAANPIRERSLGGKRASLPAAALLPRQLSQLSVARQPRSSLPQLSHSHLELDVAASASASASTSSALALASALRAIGRSPTARSPTGRSPTGRSPTGRSSRSSAASAASRTSAASRASLASLASIASGIGGGGIGGGGVGGAGGITPSRSPVPSLVGSAAVAAAAAAGRASPAALHVHAHAHAHTHIGAATGAAGHRNSQSPAAAGSPARLSPAAASPARLSPAHRLSPAAASNARLSPASASSVRLSPARFSPARMSPAQVSPARHHSPAHLSPAFGAQGASSSPAAAAGRISPVALPAASAYAAFDSGLVSASAGRRASDVDAASNSDSESSNGDGDDDGRDDRFDDRWRHDDPSLPDADDAHVVLRVATAGRDSSAVHPIATESVSLAAARDHGADTGGDEQEAHDVFLDDAHAAWAGLVERLRDSQSKGSALAAVTRAQAAAADPRQVVPPWALEALRTTADARRAASDGARVWTPAVRIAFGDLLRLVAARITADGGAAGAAAVTAQRNPLAALAVSGPGPSPAASSSALASASAIARSGTGRQSLPLSSSAYAASASAPTSNSTRSGSGDGSSSSGTSALRRLGNSIARLPLAGISALVGAATGAAAGASSAGHAPTGASAVSKPAPAAPNRASASAASSTHRDAAPAAAAAALSTAQAAAHPGLDSEDDRTTISMTNVSSVALIAMAAQAQTQTQLASARRPDSSRASLASAGIRRV